MRIGPTRIVTAAVIAAVLFLLGAIALGGSAKPDSDVTAAPDAGALLAPTTAAGSLDATIASLAARVEQVPRDWQATASLGLAYLQRARTTADPTSYPLAQAALSRSLEIRPRNNPDALIGIGSLAAARHDFGAALRWGHRAVRAAPFDADAYGLLGDAQLELGRYEAAFRSFQTMVDTRPNLASYARVSYARELLGDLDGAIRAMRAAHAAAGGRADAAWAAAQVGELHFSASRIDRAESWFRRARSADPSSVKAEAGLASVAWATGDLDRAVAGYERLVGRYPAPEYVAVLGDLYTRTGRQNEAIARYDLVRAEARLFRANGVNTDLEIALFEADHARAGSARRRSVDVADALAWALYANGRYRQAAVMSDEALRLGTRSALFLFHAGMIQLRLGRPEAAREMLKSAMDQDPNFSVRWSPLAAATLERLARA